MKSKKTLKLKKISLLNRLSGDDSAWTDFLMSKASLALASAVLFAALFQLVAGFKALEAQEQLDFLTRDFKAAVDKTGAGSFPDGNRELFYRFDENEVFLASTFGDNIEVCVSGEYVHLKAETGGRIFSSVRPFTFRVVPVNESEFRKKLYTRFGADGSQGFPLEADLQEVTDFLQASGTEEAVLSADEMISIKKETVYLKGNGGGSAFEYVLIYQ